MKMEFRAQSQYKTIFAGIVIPIKKVRQFSEHFNGLVQDCCNSIANALELLQYVLSHPFHL